MLGTRALCVVSACVWCSDEYNRRSASGLMTPNYHTPIESEHPVVVVSHVDSCRRIVGSSVVSADGP